MVAGQRPFEGKNPNAVLLAIGRSEPRPVTELAAGDAELWAILAKGLAKDRRERWPSMRAFGEALARWLLSRGTTEDIAGVAVDSMWMRPLDGATDDLGTAPPLASSARESVTTLRRAGRPLGRGERARLLTAAVALGLLCMAGLGAGFLSRSGPEKPLSNERNVDVAAPPKDPSSPPRTPDITPRVDALPIPLEDLSQIPVNGAS